MRMQKYKYNKKFLILILGLVVSQSFAQFSIKKYTINSGGSKLTGGTVVSNFEMNASIGQADASSTLSNGVFSLNGGYWHENNDLIFKNGFE